MKAVFLGWKDVDGNLVEAVDVGSPLKDLKIGQTVEVEYYMSSSGAYPYRTIKGLNLFRESELSFKTFEEVNLDDYL